MTPAIVAVTIVIVWFGKVLLEAVAERLSDRVADWLLPPNRPATYRLAQLIAFVALHLAPRRSSARRAAEAARADIDEIARTGSQLFDPIRIAVSLVPPAASARCVRALELLSESSVLVVIPAAVALFVFAGALTGIVGTQQVSRRERRVFWLISLGFGVAFAACVFCALHGLWALAAPLGIVGVEGVGMILLVSALAAYDEVHTLVRRRQRMRREQM